MPDTHGAAGKRHYVQIVNRRVRIMKKKKPNPVTTDVSLATFFGYGTQPLFDPQAVYDHRRQRWILTAEAFPESTMEQLLFVAVSVGRNPNGAFSVYRLNVTEAGEFFDRPMLGFNKAAFYLTANIFDGSAPGSAYLETNVLVFPKAPAYGGQALTATVFDVGPTGSMAPPIVLDKGGRAFFLQAPTSGDVLRLWRGRQLDGDDPLLTFIAEVPGPPYSVPADAPQPGTTALLDTSDARFVNASTQYRDRLWNVHTVNVPATARFYEIRTGIAQTFQVGDFWASDTSSDFNASIAANPRGEAFVTWTSTDAASFVDAQMRYSGRGPGDPQGSMNRPGSVLVGSPTFYEATGDPVQRWGDYSAVTLDPVSYGSCAKRRRAWIVNETIKQTDVWGSRIGRIGFC